jgi:hypothetical protein
MTFAWASQRESASRGDLVVSLVLFIPFVE